MADFLDSEAEESDNEELSPNEKKKLKRHKAIDTDDEEEEEDDEEKIREELKDLIDDNPIEDEESEGEDSDASGTSKKRKKSDEEFDDRLEDDDYDLLEENLGHKIERKKKFKRLRRLDDDESGDEHEEHDEGEDRDAIANELFEGSDHEDEDRPERSAEAEQYDVEEDEGEYSDDDDDGFIVDDDGRPIAEKRKKRKPIFNDAALQEAQDIFGVDFDFDEFEKFGDEYEEEEDEYDVEEGAEDEHRRRKEKKKVRKTTRKSIFEIYEPSELKRGHFTDLDNEIRNTDIPERMQLRDFKVTPVPEGSDELDEEAEWIYRQAFCKPTISVQEGTDRDRPRRGPQTIGKIKRALDFIRNQNFEVPFIAFYRKEYVLPELNINDLWKVYKFDEKWCQLRTRKNNLVKLFEKMRDYQAEILTQNIDAPIPDDVRILSEDDIERLKNVKTMDELKDVHMHFLLYYSQDIPTMVEANKKREKEAEKLEKRRKKLEEKANGEGDDDDEDEADDEEDEAEKIPEETIKQAVRSGPYAMCRKAGLTGLSKKFGLTPAQFGENLRDNYQRHEVDQESTEPLQLAKSYITRQFNQAEDILKAVKFMVATQLAREPLVRKCVRETFFEKAKIDVKPTKKGIKEIDENHACYSMKYLKGKPVRDLQGDQFMKLSMAEDDKLITITFDERIPGLTSPSYIEEVKQLYYRDEFSKNVQDWNALRVECVEIALKKILLPDLKKELRTNLLLEAREFILKSCSKKLYNWIKVAPFTSEFDNDDDDWDTSKGLRILGVAFVPDLSQAAFACIVGPDGECTDYLRLPNLLKRKMSMNKEDNIMKENDLAALKNIIQTKKPHAVVVGGESRDAIMIKQDIQQIITSLVEDDDFASVAVEILDNELAKTFSNSLKGESEFRDYPHLLRQAISLARRMQDPLIEFSQLCTSDEEILCLRYHPLQDQVPKEELLESLYLEFVNRTNEVGVDVNRAVAQAYTGNLVQFICGFGPRKAAALLKTLKQNNQRLENRTQLVTACHMGPKVFINCAGFIKIDTNSLGDSTEAYVEVLDGSRVHPETYEWARKMAVDALEYDDEEANPAGALEEILESPERLKDLDLDAFAEELERQGFGNKSITLYDIRAELNHRYKDLRTPYRSPNPEELFDMLTKENPETFFIGKMVLATVVGITHKRPKGDQLDQANPVRNDETGLWQCPFCLKNDFPELSEVWNHFDAGSCPGQATGVRLRLDNGINGYIHVRNLSDKHVSNPEERVQKNQMIHCRITKIEVDRFSVECTSKSSDLADKNHEWRPPKDPYYDHEVENKDIKTQEDAKKMKARQQYIKRVIVHPAFHNIGYAESEKIMSTLEQGEAIIRPSSKGANHLTVTWKVTEDILQHIDVREEGKENAFSLGQSLWIGNEEFEDLDEIIARHINPMASHARDILSFKNYRDTEGGRKEKAEEMLREEKKKNPSKIHYFISASKSLPGKFLLSYLPRNRCRHEYVTVTPDGFRFRQQMFDSINLLFRWFKEHFRDPIPGTPGTPRVTRTPFHGGQTPSINLSGINPESIQRVAQALPNHMLQSLTQVASQTPHYPPHTPGQYHYANTPYTPSGQTPFMTPYATPHVNMTQTPRYGAGAQTPPHPGMGTFVHPGGIRPAMNRVTPGYRTPSHMPPASSQHQHQFGSRPYGGSSVSNDPLDWQKAAEAWARRKSKEQPQNSRGTPRDVFSTPRMGTTPRYDESSKSWRHEGERSSSRNGHRHHRGHSSSRDSIKSFGTPMTNTSPHSMVESSIGDGTPLYDEN
ncbi:hypothetical protein RUM44_007637 [Polyplax serrata]|uniref:S1 motif domain-containing protein n=1 Tax=Polyplax serrata TaxID=468196 RepID=A0ABR1B702_POLSC